MADAHDRLTPWLELVSVVAGSALALAYPRAGWSILAWVVLAPLLVVADAVRGSSSSRRS